MTTRLNKTLKQYTHAKQLRLMVIYYNVVSNRRQVNWGLYTILGLLALASPMTAIRFGYTNVAQPYMDIGLAISAIATFALGKIIIKDIRISRLLSQLLDRIHPEFDKLSNDQIHRLAPGKHLLDAYHQSCATVR